MNLNKIREDFPILSLTLPNGKKLVYLDNAATTQKPVQVVRKVFEVYRESYANIHRSGHYLAQRASRIFEEVREKASKFINASDPNEVIFVWNTTHGINLVAIPLLELSKKKGKKEVLISTMEHHSNMLPWRRAASLLGLDVKYIPVNADGTLNYDSLEQLISKNTAVVALTHASNVTGVVNDVKRVAKLAHENEAFIVVDGAQYAPHAKVDVKEIDADFYVFSGHKMLAPEGTGVLYGRIDILKQLNPLITGGGTIKDVTLDDVVYLEPPHRYEAGTPNIAGVAGLGEAIDYLKTVGLDNILNHEKILLGKALKRSAELEKIIVYGPKTIDKRLGIFSFNFRGLNPHIAGQILNEDYGIAVRTGLHCAHPYHYALGANEGTVRASFYLYNTIEEIDYLMDSLVNLERTILKT
jgi:cysteine desulfurase/selenocysteine lyase